MKVKMSKSVIILAAIMVISLSGCVQQPNEGNVGNNTVTINGFAYSPRTITISPGETVTWTNSDSVAHTVTVEGEFDSGNIQPGATFSQTFENAGTYNYVCTLHPYMTGKVIVEE